MINISTNRPKPTAQRINRVITDIRKGVPLTQASAEHLGFAYVIRRLWEQDPELKARIDKARADARAAKIRAAHGTVVGYTHYRCRCPQCSAAGRNYARQYQKLKTPRPQVSCSACGVAFSTNKSGLMRRHGRPTRSGEMNICPGAGKPPRE